MERLIKFTFSLFGRGGHMEDNTFIIFLILLLAGFVLLTQGPTGRAVYTDDNSYSVPEQDASYVLDNELYNEQSDIYNPMPQVIQEKQELVQQMGSEDLNKVLDGLVNNYPSQPLSSEAAIFANTLLKEYQPQQPSMNSGDAA